MAKLRFYFGAMGSAKSLNLLATAHSFKEKGIPFMLLKPGVDNRDGKRYVKSRAGLKMECVSVASDVNIYEAVKTYNDVRMANQQPPNKWVLVDECQFLTPEQVDQLSDVVDLMDTDVICYGLRTDFKSKLFEASKRLFEIADDIFEVKSSCKCGRKATVNARFDKDGNIIKEGNQFMIGGDDVYQPLCRLCYKKKIRENYEASY